jgi:sugar phosphate isomerase/epimerase
MSIACSTAIACGSSLETALERIAQLGFDKIDILTIDGWKHVNTQDIVEDFEGTMSRLDALLQHHNLTPIATIVASAPNCINAAMKSTRSACAKLMGCCAL